VRPANASVDAADWRTDVAPFKTHTPPRRLRLRHALARVAIAGVERIVDVVIIVVAVTVVTP
jgi:hypothetical protein